MITRSAAQSTDSAEIIGSIIAGLAPHHDNPIVPLVTVQDGHLLIETVDAAELIFNDPRGGTIGGTIAEWATAAGYTVDSFPLATGATVYGLHRDDYPYFVGIERRGQTAWLATWQDETAGGLLLDAMHAAENESPPSGWDYAGVQSQCQN